MTPGFTTRARAERFAEALDASRGRVPWGVDPTWLGLVDRLEAVPDVQPRPEFAAALREQLLLAARAEPVAAPALDAGVAPSALDRLRLAPVRPHGQRRLTAAVAGLALVGAGGGMAVASQSALPGDALYPVKRTIEDVRTGLVDDPSAKGTRLIDQARDRLTEVAALAVDDGADPGAVEQTLDDFAEQAGQAGELKLEAFTASGSQAEALEIRGFTSDAVGVLTSLEATVPETALPSLRRAAQDMQTLDAVARQACGGCGGAVVDLVPELALSPVSADLGDALGLAELQAAARPGAGRDDGPVTTAGPRGAGPADRAGRDGRGAKGEDRGERAQRDDRSGSRPDRRPDGGPDRSGSVPVDGDPTDRVEEPLRALTRGDGQGLGGVDGLASSGTPSLQGLGGGLLGGAGTGPDQGRGDSTDGPGTTDGSGPRKAPTKKGASDKDPLEAVDDTIDGLFP